MTFRVKYNCLPGDCKKASTFGLVSNGNGDNIVGTSCIKYLYHSGYGYNRENDNFFMHLSAADLISGDYTGYASEPHNSNYTQAKLDDKFPRARMPAKETTWIFPSSFEKETRCTNSAAEAPDYFRGAGNGFMLAGHGLATYDGFLKTITVENIKNIDDKIDDGSPISGNIGTGWSQLSNRRIRHANAASAQGSSEAYACTNGTEYTSNMGWFCTINFVNQF